MHIFCNCYKFIKINFLSFLFRIFPLTFSYFEPMIWNKSYSIRYKQYQDYQNLVTRPTGVEPRHYIAWRAYGTRFSSTRIVSYTLSDQCFEIKKERKKEDVEKGSTAGFYLMALYSLQKHHNLGLKLNLTSHSGQVFLASARRFLSSVARKTRLFPRFS